MTRVFKPMFVDIAFGLRWHGRTVLSVAYLKEERFI